MTSCWVIGFDASTPRCVVALGRIDDSADELVAVDEEDDAPNQASERLLARVESLLAGAGRVPSDLGAVACGRGPGTFTGTRVAVASGKGLALGLKCPLIALSTLAGVAASVREQRPVLALLDARRGEVYAGLFTRELEPLGEESCASAKDVWADAVARAGGRALAVGPGVQPYADALPADSVPLVGPSGEGLWRATVAAYRRGNADQPAAALAVYLRGSYAELGINRPKRPFKRSPFL